MCINPDYNKNLLFNFGGGWIRFTLYLLNFDIVLLPLKFIGGSSFSDRVKFCEFLIVENLLRQKTTWEIPCTFLQKDLIIYTLFVF